MIGQGGDRLKALDRYAARPARLVGAGIGQVAGRLRPQADKPLVLRPGGLGDLICAHMALDDLGVSPAHLLWVVESRSAAWAELFDFPHVRYDAGMARLVARVAGRHGIVVNTEQHFGLSQAVAAAARRPKGTVAAFATNRLAHGADVVVPYDWDAAHETVEFRRLFAAALGLPHRHGLPERPRLAPSDGTLVVGLGGTHSPSRSFTGAQWAGFVDSWAGPRPVVIVAAPADRALADELARLRPATELFTGTFAEVCARVATAESLLTVDGGMVHIASYYGVPTTALFTSGRSGKWAPLAAGSSVVRRTDLACQPCTVFGQTPACPHGLACKAISLEADRFLVR